MTSVNTYEKRIHLCRRDEQLLWNVGLLLNLMALAEAGRDWYQGRSRTPLPSDDAYLSCALQVREVGQKRMRHRVMSLVQAMDQDETLESEAYKNFVSVTKEFFATLKSVAQLASIDVAEREFDELIAYAERVAKSATRDEKYPERIIAMGEAYIKRIEAVGEDFRKLEYELLGHGPVDPDLKPIAMTIAATNRKVSKILREKRGDLGSQRTRNWILGQVAYYREHLNELKYNIAGKKFTIKHVWDTVELIAKRDHQIRDYAHFKRMYDTESRYRRKVGGTTTPVGADLRAARELA